MSGGPPRSDIHIKVAPEGAAAAPLALAALKGSPETARANAKFVLATDGPEFPAEDVESGDIVVCDYPDFHEQFGFLPAAGRDHDRQADPRERLRLGTHTQRQANESAGKSEQDPIFRSARRKPPLRREGPDDPERQAGANTAAGRTWTPISRPPTPRNRVQASKRTMPSMVSAGIPRKRTSKTPPRKGGQGSSLGPDLGGARRQVTSVLVQPDGS